MEYALLIDSYRTVTVKPKSILSTDNLAYLCGLFLLIIPFSKLRFYFTFVTLGYFLLVFLFLFAIDWRFLNLTLKKKQSGNSKLKLKIEYKKKLNIGLNFNFDTYSLVLFFRTCSFNKNRNYCLGPPKDPG